WRRDALILALLAVRPLRLANLTTLRAGQELIRDAEGFQLSIPASETKSRREIMLNVPAILTGPLERYLRRERPFLLGKHLSEDRVRLCRELASRQGCSVIEVYADRALSAASSLRPGYQGMLTRVRAGGVDLVLAESLDRLSRDQEKVTEQQVNSLD